MTAADRPLVLLVGTGHKDYRRYLLEEIAPHYRLHLVSPAAPTWEEPYLAGSTQVADLGDADALTIAAKDAGDVSGVLCWDEAFVLPVARVAEALGLPGPGSAAVAACRDKHLTRTALAAAGVAQPESVLVASAGEALAAAGRIGYPVVLKPRALAASLGVVRVDTPAQLEANFAFARDTTVPGAPAYEVSVLVERFADGPEISVDAVVHRGRVTPMVLARKELGYPPYFEELGHLVDAADPLLRDEAIAALLQATHDALGFADGVTHTELRLTPAGPVVIEVNARLGGDLIPYLGSRATGVTPGLAAAAACCGIEPQVRPGRALSAGVRFLYAEREDTRIATIGFAGEPLPAAVDRMVLVAGPGTVASPPPKGTTMGRLGFVTAVAPTAGEVAAALAAAAADLRVTS
ncbi:ATP-grasp domain-containing protein [Dactylosporangium sp. CA-139114]|uniref:ATP-grasp domain-containing protein n=1 Tax=Dactylosporangium sp. CA-139114 TaxID=3239931 RepID=UPI003D976E2D